MTSCKKDPLPVGPDLVWSRLSSPIAKNFPLPAPPKSLLSLPPSRPTRGAYRDRHGRGVGCGGRGSVGRCQGMAGRVDTARELTNGTQTNGANAYGKAVWSWHPLLVSSQRRQVGPTGSDKPLIPDDG